VNNDLSISFIGAGNMAGSIVGGLLAKDFPAKNIWVSSPADEHLQSMRKRFGVNTSTDNRHCAQQSDILVLAVKPQVMRDVCRDLAPVIQNTRPLVISIAAGLETPVLDRWLGGEVPLVRCMPNTPALVGKGAAGLFATEKVSDAQRQQTETVFTSVGTVCWVEEEALLHTVTALSGSGPAYCFLFLEALEQAARDAGLAPETARTLAIQTMAGAAEMAALSGDEPAQLKRNVMSPGGTTERAIETFEKGDFRALVARAFEAARQRSEELSSQLGSE